MVLEYERMNISAMFFEASGVFSEQNLVVFLLLLPLVASLVSVLHYVVGISGYGSYTPTMIALAFLATGVWVGVFLFGLILVTLMFSSGVLKKLKIHYWPARSISLMMVSLIMLFMSKYVNISIFPVLFMIVLAEEFVKTELIKSKGRARELLAGTLLLALLGAGLMGNSWVMSMTLKYPLVVICLVVFVNLWVGRYGGMRVLEIKRFGVAIRKK